MGGGVNILSEIIILYCGERNGEDLEMREILSKFANLLPDSIPLAIGFGQLVDHGITPPST